MIKFKFTGERCAEVLGIPEYILIRSGDRKTAINVLPRFVLDGKGDYIVNPVLDEDGDLKEFNSLTAAVGRMAPVTPKRSEQLAQELMEAVRSIVGPSNGGDSNEPSSTAPQQPPPG